jgi:PLP dependent protein
LLNRLGSLDEVAEMTSSLTELRTSYDEVCEKISARARACGRAPEEITLVAVSKTHPVATLRMAIEIGITDFGENRVQEADTKISELRGDAARWHLIGHLQANKARRAVRLFDVIHSLDSIPLAQRLDQFCDEENRNELSVLIQVDLAGEETKSGVAEEELAKLVKAVNDCSRLRLIGLMTLPPFFEDAEEVRPFFRRLKELRDQFQSRGSFGNKPGELSMGMSHDFEVAIEEGATMLRIGTAIFGERSLAA